MKLIFALLSFFSFWQSGVAHVMSDETKNALARLQTTPVTGIEVLIAGESYRSAASAFGHSMIRFVLDSNDPYNDIVLSFVAEGGDRDEDYLKKLNGSNFHRTLQSMRGLAKYMVKGEFGFYTIGVDALSLRQSLERFSGEEGRSLTRIIIPTSSSQRAKMVEGVMKLTVKESRPYYYSAFNCAVAIQRLLQYAGLTYLPWATTTVPTELEDAFHRLLWTPYPGIDMINVPAITKKIFSNLKSSTNQSPTDQETLDVILKLDKLSLLRIYELKSEQMNTEVANALAKQIRKLPGEFTVEEIYGTKIFGSAAYELSETNQILTLNKEFAEQKSSFCPRLDEAIRYRQSFSASAGSVPLIASYRIIRNNYCQK